MVPGLHCGLLRLSVAVDKRTFEIMAAPDAHKLSVLIDINRNIATGLSTTNSTAA